MSGERRKAMIPDERYVIDEDAAKHIHATPITFRRWLAVGVMPQFQFGDTRYVLQSDVDAFVEACQCRSQRQAYEPKPAKTVAA
jgi:hypothetical protein